MGMSLYEINQQIEELTERLIDEETGEINEEVEAQLAQLDIDLDEKLESYGIVIKNLMAEVTALMAEKKSLEARIKTRTNKIDRMMEFVNRILKGQKKKLKRVEFSYRPSSSVEVVNEDIVPGDMCKFDVVKKPMKADIKKLLAAGKEVPGCVLVKKNNLNVK